MKISILASCDDNYAPHVGVLFISVLKNTVSPQNIDFFLIDNGITSKNQALIKNIVEGFKSRIYFISAIEKDFKNFPTMRYGIATYQRLAMAELLPADVKKVIYLDSDMVVVGDISELWNTPLDNQPISAVENLSPKASLGLGLDRKNYFNAGMLVADLEYWRRNNIKTQLLDYLSLNSAKIKHLDQCALNGVFQNKWKKLPLEWNMQADAHGVLKKYAEGCGYTKEQIQNAISKPSIIHYIGKQKPWLWDCHNAYQAFYLHYKAISPWKDLPRPDENCSNKLKSRLAIKKRLRQKIRYQQLAITTNNL